MSTSIETILLEGHSCLKLTAGKYCAVLAPSLGNNMIRLRDEQNKIEFFRYDREHPYTTVQNNPVTYGYPFLYLHNRLEDGILKASDATYHFPVNEPEPYYNLLHGFLHTRSYRIVEQNVINDDAVKVVSEYQYNEQDEMFSYFPVAFSIRMTYTLSAHDGLLQEVEMRNLSSDHMLPCGFCSHTCIASPFVDNTNPQDYVLNVPIKERWELNERCLPTLNRLSLTDYDKRYVEGTMPAVQHNIDNDLYTADTMPFQNREFHGMHTTHTPSGLSICYETSKDYPFWCLWNDKGTHDYYCPEPLTWIINAPNLALPPEETGYKEIAPADSFTCWQHIYSTTI